MGTAEQSEGAEVLVSLCKNCRDLATGDGYEGGEKHSHRFLTGMEPYEGLNVLRSNTVHRPCTLCGDSARGQRYWAVARLRKG